jgi:23S rRNA-intervening sequence protein
MTGYGEDGFFRVLLNKSGSNRSSRSKRSSRLGGKAMQVKNFEDLEIWKDARVLTRGIYQLTRDPKFSKDFGLRDQIRRAAISVMSNIAEGFERGGNQEFVQFLYVEGIDSWNGESPKDHPDRYQFRANRFHKSCSKRASDRIFS